MFCSQPTIAFAPVSPFILRHSPLKVASKLPDSSHDSGVTLYQRVSRYFRSSFLISSQRGSSGSATSSNVSPVAKLNARGVLIPTFVEESDPLRVVRQKERRVLSVVLEGLITAAPHPIAADLVAGHGDVFEVDDFVLRLRVDDRRVPALLARC